MVRLLGILNLTPDSFSDGGRFQGSSAALDAAYAMVDDGAWAIDVGGESTRPGAARVPADVQLTRVLPVVKDLAATGVRVSIDTTDARVAQICSAMGATIINDVSGGLADRAMYGVAASSRTLFIASHSRGPSDAMSSRATYTNVAHVVANELGARVEQALDAGISAANLVLDPGIGFAKSGSQNWELLRGLEQIVALGYPVMLGISRKSLLEKVEERLGCSYGDGDFTRRDDLTAASSALALLAGASYLRVHNVAASRRAVAVAQEWIGAETAQTDCGRHRRSDVLPEVSVTRPTVPNWFVT